MIAQVFAMSFISFFTCHGVTSVAHCPFNIAKRCYQMVKNKSVDKKLDQNL